MVGIWARMERVGVSASSISGLPGRSVLGPTPLPPRIGVIFSYVADRREVFIVPCGMLIVIKTRDANESMYISAAWGNRIVSSHLGTRPT